MHVSFFRAHSNGWQDFSYCCWNPSSRYVHIDFFLGGRNPHMKSHYRGHHVAVWLQLIPQLHQPGGVAEVPIGIHHQFDGQQDPSTDQLYEGEIERNNYILPAGIMHLFCIIQVSFECREWIRAGYYSRLQLLHPNAAATVRSASSELIQHPLLPVIFDWIIFLLFMDMILV